MSTRTQWVCVPWIESRSRPKVVESSPCTAPPNARPNTSAPNELVPVDGGSAGEVEPPGVVCLPLATRATLPYLRWQVRARDARVLAECAFRALRRHRVRALGRFFLFFALAFFLAA